MAVLNKRTRAQIRQSIGYNLGAMQTGTTTDSGSAGQVFDNQNLVFGTVNELRGKWLVFSDSGDSNGGLIRPVLSFEPDGYELNTVPFTNRVANNVNYELWDRDIPPARIHDFINRAIESVTRRGVVPLSDTQYAFGGNIRSFTFNDSMVALENIQFRRSVVGKEVALLDTAMTSSDTTNVTVAKDDEDYRVTASNRITFAAGFGTGEVATDTISSTDLGGMTHIEYWYKANDTTAAGDFDLFLNDTSTEQFSVPAVDTADEWKYTSVAMANPESDTAITVFGINADADPGTKTVWFDNVMAYRDGTQQWDYIHPAFWELDKANRALVFKPEFRIPGATPFILNGYRKPSLLTSDTQQSDIDAEFIIARATAMALRARADRTAQQREAAHLEAERQDGLAEIHRNRMQLPRQARWLD